MYFKNIYHIAILGIVLSGITSQIGCLNNTQTTFTASTTYNPLLKCKKFFASYWNRHPHTGQIQDIYVNGDTIAGRSTASNIWNKTSRWSIGMAGLTGLATIGVVARSPHTASRMLRDAPQNESQIPYYGFTLLAGALGGGATLCTGALATGIAQLLSGTTHYKLSVPVQYSYDNGNVKVTTDTYYDNIKTAIQNNNYSGESNKSVEIAYKKQNKEKFINPNWQQIAGTAISRNIDTCYTNRHNLHHYVHFYWNQKV